MTLDLAQLKKHFQAHSTLALTIESEGITLSVVHQEGKAGAPISVALSAGELFENPAQAGAKVAAALDAAGIRERRCAVCLPLSWALTTSADLPEISPEDLRGYFELRAEREFSTADLRLAHNPYTLPDGQKRATLAAIPIKRMEAVETLLQSAACRPVSISLALKGSLARPEPMLNLLANGDQTDVLVSCGGGIAAMRTLSNPVSCGTTEFSRELRITLGRLPETLRESLRSARIVGSPELGLRQIVEKMGFERIFEENGGTGGAAVECAELHLRNASAPFEFLVPQVSRWPAALERINTRRGHHALGLAAALILLPLLVFSVRSHMENSMNAEWNGMKNNVAELEVLQQKIRQFRPWFEPSPQKLLALETLVSTFPERGEIWTRSVQIAAISEKNDAASQLAQSNGVVKITVAGFARNSATLLSLQDRLPKQPGVSALQLQQIRGNNPIQFSLNFKWEPKHDK